MTNTLTPAANPDGIKIFDRRTLIRMALISLTAIGIVFAAVAPQMHSRPAVHHLRAHLHWPELGRIAIAAPAIQIHLAGVAVAIAIGLILLVGVKGTTAHRVLGWGWVLAMGMAAVSSLFIRVVNHGQFSLIHLISAWTIVSLPMALAAARRHKVKVHARMMTGMFTGGLVLAGVTAFVPGRLMWQLFFG
jgi:uncharacterized membrane protein